MPISARGVRASLTLCSLPRCAAPDDARSSSRGPGKLCTRFERLHCPRGTAGAALLPLCQAECLCFSRPWKWDHHCLLVLQEKIEVFICFACKLKRQIQRQEWRSSCFPGCAHSQVEFPRQPCKINRPKILWKSLGVISA